MRRNKQRGHLKNSPVDNCGPGDKTTKILKTHAVGEMLNFTACHLKTIEPPEGVVKVGGKNVSLNMITPDY